MKISFFDLEATRTLDSIRSCIVLKKSCRKHKNSQVHKNAGSSYWRDSNITSATNITVNSQLYIIYYYCNGIIHVQIRMSAETTLGQVTRWPLLTCGDVEMLTCRGASGCLHVGEPLSVCM